MIGAGEQGYAVSRDYSVIALALLRRAPPRSAHDALGAPVIVYGLAGVAAIYYLTWRHANGILAAALADIFFSFNPHFFFVSSINLAGRAEPGRSRRHVEHYRAAARNTLWLPGAVFGLSTTFKVFVPFVTVIAPACS